MVFMGLQPPDEDNVRDRFDEVEGLSGLKHADVLRGDSRPGRTWRATSSLGLSRSRRSAARKRARRGRHELHRGNVILAGEGSDILEGRGGNDVIDGDAWLDVELEAPDVENGGTKRVDGMKQSQADVLAGRIGPGEVEIVREIKTATTAEDVDTAEFSGPRDDYSIDLPEDGEGVIEVVHLGGTQVDGTDLLKNVERR
jgi:hypothetical protein